MTLPRRPQDINQRFGEAVLPEDGPAFRFELEVRAFIEEDGSDPIEAEMIVSWRYGLTFRETSIYVDAREGWRPPQ